MNATVPAVSVFAPLRSWGAPRGFTLHNVRLVDEQPDGAGYQRLTVECQGETVQLQGGGRWSAEFSRRDIGKVGHLIQVDPTFYSLAGFEQPTEPACYFRPYLDQTLRRAPELDANEPRDDGGKPNVIGWRCEARMDGFRAPVGLIPGEDGGFVSDSTVAVTLRVPREFVELAGQYQHSAESLLRAFIADVCGIMNWVKTPRADGYSSNGSDERMYAEQWLDRAFAHLRVDEEAQWQREEQAAERQEREDDLVMLLDDYTQEGGDPDQLLQAVRQLVDAKRQESEASGDQAG